VLEKNILAGRLCISQKDRKYRYWEKNVRDGGTRHRLASKSGKAGPAQTKGRSFLPGIGVYKANCKTGGETCEPSIAAQDNNISQSGRQKRRGKVPSFLGARPRIRWEVSSFARSDGECSWLGKG